MKARKALRTIVACHAGDYPTRRQHRKRAQARRLMRFFNDDEEQAYMKDCRNIARSI